MPAAPHPARPRLPARFAAYFTPTVEQLGLPVYVLDRDGVVVWLNPPAEAVAGDVTGRRFTALFDADDADRAEAMFQRNVRWARHPDYSVDLPLHDGSRTRVQISSAPLGREGYAIAIFGAEETPRRAVARGAAGDRHLTERQAEILGLLAGGASNDQIAGRLSLSHETVRNHVRHVVERLGVRSRLEAVTVARADGLV